MSPLEIALEHFATTGRCFVTDCIHHSRTGRVIITPDLFVMARPVVSTWPEEWIINPAHNVSEGDHGELTPDPDCIHIHLLIGNIEDVLAYDPWGMPLVSYQRGMKGRMNLAIVPTAKFRAGTPALLQTPLAPA